MRNAFIAYVFPVLLVSAPLPMSAVSQEASSSSQRQNENTIDGIVVSATRDTLVVRTDDNQFQLFVFDRYTARPRPLTKGTRVHVVSAPGEEAGVRVASTITTLEPAPKSTGEAAQGTAAEPAPVPPAVRDLERDIKREARRWR